MSNLRLSQSRFDNSTQNIIELISYMCTYNISGYKLSYYLSYRAGAATWPSTSISSTSYNIV